MSFLSAGCDPELLLYKNDKPFPVCGLLGGTKEAPLPVNRGAIQEDNVMAEFNIHPATSVDEWLANIEEVMGHVAAKVAPLQIRAVPSADFTVEDLLEHPQAMIFGCDPDFNAYTGKTNPRPDSATCLRTAGGHIHVGYTDPNEGRNRDLVKIMDLLLGVTSVVLDTDVRRRTMYGKAGAYRNKPYGVEYRTLSNFWLRSTALRKWAFQTTQKCVEILEDPMRFSRAVRINTAMNVPLVINHSHVEGAKAVMKVVHRELY